MPSPAPWTPVPILMYHAVEDAPRPPKYKHFYVTAPEFAGQMRLLKRLGYQPITFAALHAALRGEASLPARPVLLTFDDGYENLLKNVHPLLTELQFPYTVFLVSDLVGTTNAWVKPEGYEATPLLSWAQIEAMRREGGVDFQAHTLSHPHLNRLSDDAARREIRGNKDTLEQRFGASVDVLCYPYGHHSEATVRIAREEGFTMAVTTDFGRVRPQDDLLRLPRISVYHVPLFSLTYGVGPLNFLWRLASRRDTRP